MRIAIEVILLLALTFLGRWWARQLCQSDGTKPGPVWNAVWLFMAAALSLWWLESQRASWALFGVVMTCYLYLGALVDGWSGYLPNYLHLAALAVILPLQLLQGTFGLWPLLSGVLLFVVALIPHLIKSEGMGGGDVKLAGVVGLSLGLVPGGLLFALGLLMSLPHAVWLRWRYQAPVRVGPYFLLAFTVLVLLSEQLNLAIWLP